uniref:Uncharacterized protein n=1 Tax=Aegilops tauschii subsp. strangulata TaxID=200361 RepID=A0A453SBY4_AEGTS
MLHYLFLLIAEDWSCSIAVISYSLRPKISGFSTKLSPKSSHLFWDGGSTI